MREDFLNLEIYHSYTSGPPADTSMFGFGCLVEKTEQLGAAVYVNAHPLPVLKDFGGEWNMIPKTAGPAWGARYKRCLYGKRH